MRYIALLRGVNVGGHKLVAMSDLVALLTRLGFDEPRSLLQSGNLVFHTTGRTAAQLERTLDAEVLKRLGLETKFFVRSEKEWGGVVAGNPFPKAARDDPARLIVMFLEREPDLESMNALRAAIKGRETVRADGRQLYMIYPDGQGTSKLTNAVIERKLGMRGTARSRTP